MRLRYFWLVWFLFLQTGIKVGQAPFTNYISQKGGGVEGEGVGKHLKGCTQKGVARGRVADLESTIKILK